MAGLAAIGFAAFLFTACAHRAGIDADLASVIDQTKAIDNHAHPMRLTAPGERDTDYDVLPVELMDPSWSIPPRANPNNPDYGLAQQALFGVREPAERVAAAKQAAMREHGDAYPDWILDRLGIDVMFANRAAMGRGLDPARFKWVPFADPLMYPLNNDRLGARDPDRNNFFSAERNTLDRYLKEAGASTLPARFDDYLSFVHATLSRWKRSGAVAVKFEMAYLRSLAVGNPDRAAAAKAYASYLRSGIPPEAEYKTLQDYIFRYIALECGNLNLAVHIHSLAGAGAYYDNAGANPSNLEPALNDPGLRKTKFVIIHGGWPYTGEMAGLLQKPNVYLDYSAQTYFLYPRELSRILRLYLEMGPDRVLFATDASPFTAAISWEESAWYSARTARDALRLALEGMVSDGEITHERAIQLAHMVLRENAKKLYGF
jgi:predicted TIM-barrel fold metal-dependent hydrolase